MAFEICIVRDLLLLRRSVLLRSQPVEQRTQTRHSFQHNQHGEAGPVPINRRRGGRRDAILNRRHKRLIPQGHLTLPGCCSWVSFVIIFICTLHLTLLTFSPISTLVNLGAFHIPFFLNDHVPVVSPVIALPFPLGFLFFSFLLSFPSTPSPPFLPAVLPSSFILPSWYLASSLYISWLNHFSLSNRSVIRRCHPLFIIYLAHLQPRTNVIYCWVIQPCLREVVAGYLTTQRHLAVLYSQGRQ